VKAICLVKQVPALGSIEFDEETHSLKREGVPLELNAFDGYAVQHGALLADEVVVMTMGPPQAEEALREALALGAQRAIHLSDRVFAVADTLGTSRTLAMAIEKEGADLVLCGRKALDSETWQVPSQAAAFLGWPHVTNVAGVERSGDMLRLTRQTDFGEEVYEAGLPVVVSVGLPPEQETSGDADGPIEVWQATDLVGQVFEYDKRFGQTGSPTRVLAVRDSRPERAGIRAADGDEAAAKVRDLLAQRAPEAPSWEKPAHIAEEPAASYDCWSVCELIDGRPRRVSLELIARSRELAGKLGGRAVALLIGHELDEPAREAAQHGAEVLYLADDPALAEYHPELWTAVLRRVLVEHLPRVMLVPATGRGRDYGGRARARHDRGLRRCRHRQGGAPAAAEARVRRQHRLGHPRSDDAAAGHGAPTHVRAARAAGLRCGGPSPRPRLVAGAEGESRRAGTELELVRPGRERRRRGRRPERRSRIAGRDQGHGRRRRRHARSV
jgi:electron transfer flavoprotein alpha/beta subunit